MYNIYIYIWGDSVITNDLVQLCMKKKMCEIRTSQIVISAISSLLEMQRTANQAEHLDTWYWLNRV